MSTAELPVKPELIRITKGGQIQLWVSYALEFFEASTTTS